MSADPKPDGGADMYDVCVITTIHPPFDGRVYERGVKAYTGAGLRTAFVGPWEHVAESGVEPAGWVTTRPSRSRLDRLGVAYRTYRAALSIPARVYHFHDPDFLPFGVRLQRVTGSPVIYDCHELNPEDILYHKLYIPAPLRWPLSTVARYGERWAVRALGQTIVVVPFLQQRFQEYGAHAELIRNFTRSTVYPDLPHERALLFSGTVQDALGADVLLAMAEILARRAPDVPVIVPDRFVSEPLRQQFIEASKRLPLRIVPQVRAAELDKIMRLGCIGLVTDPETPSMAHGMHAKFFDYMAYGLPLVASDLANARQLVEKTGCGVLVPPADPEAFVSACLDLLNDPQRLERMRQDGFRGFLENYSWPTERERLVSYVRSLAASPRN